MKPFTTSFYIALSIFFATLSPIIFMKVFSRVREISVPIPSFLLPKLYNYFEKKPVKTAELTESERETCSICMNFLDEDSDITIDPNARIPRNFLTKQKDNIMNCPCNHKFHNTCLVNWMCVKMECPSCRLELPIYWNGQ